MFGFRRKYTREIAHFVQLSGKLGRRLGVARSRARQAESEAAFWKERAQEAAKNALTFKANQEQLEVELAQYKRAVNRQIETKLNESLDRGQFPAGTIGW